MNKQELRELNEWVAEHVMGFEWWTSKISGRRCIFAPGMIPRCADEWFTKRADMTEKTVADYPPSWLPCYTTDPAAAMEVLKKCLIRQVVTIDDFGEEDIASRYALKGEGFTSPGACAQTIELAICIFAKKLFSK